VSQEPRKPPRSDRPLVSVLTPSFQQGRFLTDCIASVCNQTYPELEQIVYDGGSTDETIGVLEAAPPTVQWVSEPDRGQSHALNKAFAKSRGEIIGWLNSDDAYFDHMTVAHVVDTFLQRPEVDVVYGHAVLVNADGLILHTMWVPPFDYRWLRRANFVIQPAAFIRRSALGERMVDEEFDYSMDRELWLRLGAARRFARIDAILAIDRHQPNRKVYTRPDLARADEQRLIEVYGIPPNARYQVPRKLVKAASRVFGMRLVRAARGPNVFNGSVDDPFRLMARQIAVTRGAMPFEETPADAA
jgi:glycosyltransferase involved in cell wall biosynthesis